MINFGAFFLILYFCFFQLRIWGCATLLSWPKRQEARWGFTNWETVIRRQTASLPGIIFITSLFELVFSFTMYMLWLCIKMTFMHNNGWWVHYYKKCYDLWHAFKWFIVKSINHPALISLNNDFNLIPTGLCRRKGRFFRCASIS